MWWLIGGAVLLAGLVSLGIWFIAGNRVWTDGGSIRVADRDTKVREVIWTRPAPLEGFSSDEQVYEPSVSPDGTELYFVRGKAGRNAKIYVSYRRNNAWTSAVAVDTINGPFDSLGPRVTPDGGFLLFYSDRPGGLGGYDIWASPRTKDGWGRPFNLGPHVNSEFNEFNPDPTPDGRHLIFATNRKAAKREQNEAWRSTIRETVSSDYDLWIANADFSLLPAQPPETRPATLPAAQSGSSVNLAFSPAREIPGINTPFTEGASCMSPPGDFLYFSSNRPGGLGKFDIYRCRVHGEQFAAPENVGPSINSSENEADPALAYNGFRMFFSSDRPGADGRYHLLASDSREVYPERQRHSAPHLGWSWLVLLISLLVLIPLLMFFRGWDDKRLNTIQKCLLLSLLVHALITFILSFVAVTQKVTQYVRGQMELDVPVNLREGQGVEESLAIRGQVSSDLPVSGAASASLPQEHIASDPIQMSAPTDVSVPGERIAPSRMTIAADTPHPGAPMPVGHNVEVAAAAGPSGAVDVKLPMPQGVSQTELDLDPSPAESSGGKTAAADVAMAPNGGGGPADLAVPASPITKSARPTDLPVAAARRGGAIPGRAGDALGPGALPSPQIGSTGQSPTIGALAVAATPGLAATSEPRLAASPNQSGPAARAVPQAAASTGNAAHPQDVQIASGPAAGPSTRPSVQSPGINSREKDIASLLPADMAQPHVGSTGRDVGALHAAPAVDTRLAGKTDAGPPEGTLASAAIPTRVGGDRTSPTGAPPTLNAGGGKLSASETIGRSVVASPVARVTVPSVGNGSLQSPALQANAGNDRGPQVSGPRMSLPGGAIAGGQGGEKPIRTDAAALAISPAKTPDRDLPAAVEIAPAPLVAATKLPAGGKAAVPKSAPPKPIEITSSPIQPEIGISSLSGPLGPPVAGAPDLTVIRAPEQRKPLLEQFGGTKESEDAVERGLAYLARMQQRDGYWTRVETDERPDDHARGHHDMACTGFALLAFLGHDHTPDKPGPYHDAVNRAVDWLISQQDDDGDLRGPERFRGGGADSANMYDQGIATYALAECAIMTHDPRTIEAAVKGARFIVQAQNRRSGGWRYSPNEYGDSSVFGWQIMALHSARQVGFEIPRQTIDGAKRYVQTCAEGRHGLLAGYQPHQGPTSAMTSELLFSRMLLDMPLDEDGIDEATRFLARNPPDLNNADLYYWYYASLSMLHMRNPLWKDWNVLTRESLIRMQQKEGDSAGCWDTNIKWGERGGRVFTTALATLTLEVYYRYLPLRKTVGEN